MPRRLRLDAELVRRGLARSREHAADMIAAKRVKVAGVMATRCGGASIAASHWTAPGYERPKVPTLPLLQGCTAAHSMVS